MTRTRWILLAVYLVLLTGSAIVQSFAPTEWYRLPTPFDTLTDVAPTEPDTRPMPLAALAWGNQNDTRPPVILIHGSPGQATDYAYLGPELSSDSRPVYSLDMPGFGYSEVWVPSYSARAYAAYVLAFMDARGIERAHLVGWSNGGAVVLHATDLATIAGTPDRIASITMLGAIGLQETEGSGDYYFEHAKYALGYAALVVLPEFIPHFGLLYPRENRVAFIRNFWDTDQRTLEPIMRSLETPSYVLHGRNDFLVSDWAAERHHDVMPTSRLTMTPHSHFLPFQQPEVSASLIRPFLERHDTPGVEPLAHTADLDPVRVRTGALGALDAIARSARDWPWWLVVPIGALFARFRPETTTVLLAYLCASLSLDFGVAAAAVYAGRRLTPCGAWDAPGVERATVRAITDVAWTAIALLLAQSAMASGLTDAWAGLGFVVALALTTLLLRVVRTLPTPSGRRRLLAWVTKWLHHEWWPSWMLYAGLVPTLVRLGLQHKSLLVWTAANPGVPPDEGIQGESKAELLDKIKHPSVLPYAIVAPAGTSADRAVQARELVDSRAELGGFPIVVKPDAGERGRDVAIARSPDDLESALAPIAGPAMLQKFHPGPLEVGVFWIRRPETVGDPTDDSSQRPQGFVFAITRKTLPEVTGDGRRTLRQLVERHPRYRKQMAVHARRDDFDTRVPADGESLRLTEAGNHSRGCMFSDGEDLRTPDLEAAVDAVASAYRGPNGEPYDFGRFDLRATGEDELRAGRFAVIELNGTTSEATNLYDPKRSTRWAYSVLAKQWGYAFELGAKRAKQGSEPITMSRLVAVALRAFMPR
ncbi:MAG: alpha/beta fold hydrolase [Planctomycetota bacterium]